jgi:hypothetical protein
LAATLVEQGQQQITLKLVLTRVENTLQDGGGGWQFSTKRGSHNNEGGTSNDGGGTTHKLEFPKFNGKGDPLP